MEQPIPELTSRRASEEEQYFLRLAREDQVAAIGRIEETAKFIMSVVGSVAGLVLAALQVKIAVAPQAQLPALLWPFLLWGISLLCAVFVILPLPYKHIEKSPDSIQRYLKKARWVKWSLLLLTIVLFVAGLLVLAWQF